MSFIPLINPQWCDDVPHVKYGNCSPMPIDTKNAFQPVLFVGGRFSFRVLSCLFFCLGLSEERKIDAAIGAMF